MDICGCGFNGFGQLLPQVPKRCVLSPVKIDGCQEQNASSTSNKTSITFPKILSSWSTTYVLTDSSIFLQGFCNGQKGNSHRLKRAEGDGKSILDMAIGTEEKLYYVLANGGECIVTDVHSNQNSKVLVEGFDDDDGESERPNFLRISAGEMNAVAVTDKSSGFISTEKHDYIFRPFDCTLKFSQVSCGKEHVMLLSQHHQAYTFGLGSRGQLGHGSTDREGQPRLVEATAGVPMATVSAGGWHSSSVSTIGDLYIWGWNESGQLGFLMQRTPSKTDKTCPNAPAASQDLPKSQDKLNLRMTRTLEDGSSRRPHPQESDLNPASAKKRRTFSDSGESADASTERLLECGSDANSAGMYMVNEGQFESAISAQQISFTTSDELHEDDIGGKSERQFENVNKTGSKMSSQGTQGQDFSKPKALLTASGGIIEDPGGNKSREQIENREVDPRSRGREDAADDSRDDDESQASDVVLFQALPAILDLPGGKDVSKVSCGSRHTAAISVDGELYTWGWGAYGQLGHGDRKTLDVPTLVKSLPEDQKVLDVFCGAWNTLITVAAYL